MHQISDKAEVAIDFPDKFYPKFGGSGEFAGPSLLLLNPE